MHTIFVLNEGSLQKPTGDSYLFRHATFRGAAAIVVQDLEKT